MKVGDYVIPSTSHLWEYFQKGPRRIKSIREVGGSDGDAITVNGVKNAVFWSNYLRVIE